MLRNQLYYLVKPLLPYRFRMALRRLHARRIRSRCGGVWPIDQSAAVKPEGWPGWPEGKKFAFVLTHDVEGPAGLERVQQLAEVEMELGFRSSFNFVPEGNYKVPASLRHWLTDHGFEVGVHDLRHDGRLYASRPDFSRNAERINHYLKEWGAVGFRSGFMLHNLEWIHELEIGYDASTFDTDPFEPQPDGVTSIFPFWVSAPEARGSEVGNAVSAGGEAGGANQRSEDSSNVRPPRSEDGGQSSGNKEQISTNEELRCPSNKKRSTENQEPPGAMRSGYVELPYTLPQDSTLFFCLQERSGEIWQKKLDWVADRGGMALMNVHPDYVNFGGKLRDEGSEFPVDRYREFLQQVEERYEGQYWHVLPREVARFTEKHRLMREGRRPRKICMLAYSDYDADARVIRYATTLSKRGDHVETVSRSRDGADEKKVVDGVTVYKLGSRLGLHKGGPLSHLLPLLEFFFRSAVLITKNHLRGRYDLIHVHNIPEWLVFAVWLPKLLGSKIILDIHDLVPELYAAKFNKGNRAWVEPALRVVERISCRFSDHVIISNHLWLNTIVERSMPESRCSVFFNNIDPDLFHPRARTRQDKKKIIVFPGTLQWHQGVDVAIRAFPYVLEKVPEAEFHIYGGGGVMKDLIALVAELGLEKTVLFLGSRPVSEIPQLIANADLGVVPKRADSFGNQAYSTKIMEFMSQGVPAVISRTAIDSFYFNDSQVRFCESGNVRAFAEAMVEVLTNDEVRQNLILNAHEYVARNHWGSRKREYLDLVDWLIEDRQGRAKPVFGLAAARPEPASASGEKARTASFKSSDEINSGDYREETRFPVRRRPCD